VSAFPLFDGSHLAALAVTAVAAVTVALVARPAPPQAQLIRRVLAVFVLAAGVGFVVVDAIAGVPWTRIAPLHLCDISVFVSAYALWRGGEGKGGQLAFELAYFWSLAGALPAILTPELGHDFPHFRYFFYFAQHGALVVSAVVLAIGCRLSPQRLAPLRAWLWLNLTALVIGVIDYLTDTNFLYLCAKPTTVTPLDWFGPWPYYIVGTELLALTIFVLLALPFRLRRT